MANKKTQREMFNEIITFATEYEREDIVTFAKERIAVLDKKSQSKKATKAQEENEVLKDVIVDTLEVIGKGTVTDIIKANENLGEFSNQKISALLRQLVNAKTVDKTTEKGKSIFTLAERD